MSTNTKAGRPKPGPARPAGKPLQAGETSLDLEFIEVDPGLAEEWLDHNDNNRTIRDRKVAAFKRDLLAGNWRNIGDPIRFDTNGKLVDGQHRLMALIHANQESSEQITMPLLVIRNVLPEDQVVMDTGTPRSAGDQLRMAGYKNYALLAVTAKWLIFWERKALYADANIKNVTHAEIMDWVTEHPDVHDAVDLISHLRSGIDMPPGYVSAAYYILKEINEDDADDFFHRLSDGIGLDGGDPVLALRNRLRDLKFNRSQLSGEQWLSLLMRAWNARRDGTVIRKLAIHRAGEPITCPIPH
jgi:hypothetical protein